MSEPSSSRPGFPRVPGLADAPLVARRDADLPAAAAANVVSFARPRREGAASLPLPVITAGDRHTSARDRAESVRVLAVMAASFALHGALLAFAWQAPKPLASVGIETMTVEVTLGADTAAGLAAQPGEQEAAAAPPDQDRPAEIATVMPQETPVATRDAAPEATTQAPAATQETTASAPAEDAAPDVAPAAERTRIAAPTEDKAQPKQPQPAAPSDSASGIGRGRSDLQANYNGTIAAHLQRYKQYPAAARSAGVQGVATVSFAIDGNGRVSALRLVAGSGSALIDQEVLAMVRRASPFPRTPDGEGRNFTVPVRFNLR